MATNCMTLQLFCNRVEAAVTLRKLCIVINTVKSIFNVEITHNISEIQNIIAACISKTNDSLFKNSGNVANTVKRNDTADIKFIIKDNDNVCESEFGDTLPNHGHGSAEVPSSITLCFKSKLSQENIEKAKDYVASHLTPIPDYTTYPFSLDSPSEFEMVFQNSNELQSTTLCLMTFEPDCYEVTLQGSEKSVGSARARVVMLLDNFREQKTSDVDKYSRNSRDKSSYINDLLKQSTYEITSNMTPQISDGTEKKDEFEEELRCESPHNDTYPPSHSPNLNSQDELDTSEDFLSDPRYSTQIERALKLGYSEDQVSKALKKLGPDIDSNDLLSELIAIGATDSGISEKHDKNIDAYLTVNHNSDKRSRDFHSTSSEESSVFDGVGGSNSTQSSDGNRNNLRHIIIDGSNVAMR